MHDNCRLPTKGADKQYLKGLGHAILGNFV